MQCKVVLLCVLLILFSIQDFVVFSSRVNYCGARMCKSTDAHTFCQYPPGPSPDCIGFIEAELTKDEKSRLLVRLNRRRNEAASGRLRGMPSAGDMLKMRWIEELAKEAQLWANQCRPPRSPEERDECRDLYSTSVGQCIASVVGEAPGLRVESMIDMWYMQSLIYKGNVTSYVPPEGRYFYGDFGQMLWARSYMVGCGRSRFMIPWQGRLRSVERLVCNISPAGPAPYRALWVPAEPASDCPTRAHPDLTLKSLCNYHFEMDETDVVNNTMTIEEHVLLNSVLETENNESLFDIGSLDKLYLTNLAIVTMNDIESSTSLYNSIQKRDIVKANNLENYIVRDKQTELKKIIKSNNSFNMDRKIPKKKISIIGRPKTYNMEDLTEIGDDHKEDNNEITEDIPKNFNDVYGDYNIVDAREENGTIITEVTDKKIEILVERKQTTHDYNKTAMTPVTNKLKENETLNEIDTLENYASNLLQILRDTGNMTELNVNTTEEFTKTLPKESGEDYLTDPETVRQLQQALDRVEHEKQSPKVTSKVRRELREPQNLIDNTTLVPEEERNQTVPSDRGPMLDMVMKYMPYLKEYEGGILGSTSSAGCAYPSVILVAIMFCY